MDDFIENQDGFKLKNTLNLNDLIPGGMNDHFDTSFFYYKGSMTSPPCS